MNQSKEEELLNRLIKEYEKIEPRDEFGTELEDKLVAKFSKEKKIFWYPIFGLIITGGLFLLLLLNWDDTNQNASKSEQQSNMVSNEKKEDYDLAEPDSEPEIYSEEAMVSDLKARLEMDNAIMPTTFPIDEDYLLTGYIEENTSNSYKIAYYLSNEPIETNVAQLGSIDGELIATFSAKAYEEDANSILEEFTESTVLTDIDSGKKMEIDLGFDIYGIYQEDNLRGYVNWQEGRWFLQVSSIKTDQIDNVNIATQMVEFLERKLLPAPTVGNVFVAYDEGGDSLDVNIIWNKDNVVYQLETTEVPINALDMVVSVE